MNGSPSALRAGWRTDADYRNEQRRSEARRCKVVVAAGELGKRFADRLDEIKDRVQLKGFRKGKVPVPHLKKMYGRSLMVEVLQETVARDRATRRSPTATSARRMQPSVSLPEDQAEIERVLSRQGRPRLLDDASRCCPRSSSPTLKSLKLERAGRRRRRRSRRQGAWASSSSAASRFDARGRPRRRRTATASPSTSSARSTARRSKAARARTRQLVLGQGNFIPGFEEGITGAKAGEERDVNVTFPADYPVADAGRQGRDLRRQGEGGGHGRCKPGDQRRVRQDAGRRERSTS